MCIVKFGSVSKAAPWRIVITWILALLPLAAESAGIEDAPRHALVIGNANYAFVSTLPSVENDRIDMCTTLKSLHFKVTCLKDLQTREEFLSAIEKFVVGTPRGAVSMLYYGGHGLQVSGENYLVPTQVSMNDPRGWRGQFVRLSEVFDIIRKQSAGFRFIVLDACRDDPDAVIKAPRMSTALSASVGTRNLRSLMQSVRGGGHFAATYGIAAIRDAPPNTLVLFGTGSGSVAFDGSDNQRNGPLTKHLVSEIKIEGQTITQAIEHVVPRVAAETERLYMEPQSPVTYGMSNSSFCFVSCLKTDAKLPAQQVNHGPLLTGG